MDYCPVACRYSKHHLVYTDHVVILDLTHTVYIFAFVCLFIAHQIKVLGTKLHGFIFIYYNTQFGKMSNGFTKGMMSSTLRIFGVSCLWSAILFRSFWNFPFIILNRITLITYTCISFSFWEAPSMYMSIRGCTECTLIKRTILSALKVCLFPMHI